MTQFVQRLFLLSVLLVPLFGCQSTTGYYLGAVAAPDSVVSIAESGKGTWQDLYVDVKYTVERRGDRLVVAGNFGFANHPQMMMARVHDFTLKFFLLDQQNRVLDYADLANTLGPQLDTQTSFSHEFVLPAGAVVGSFGYDGSFFEDTDSGDQGGSALRRVNVWKLPRTSP